LSINDVAHPLSLPTLEAQSEHLAPVTRKGYRDGDAQKSEFILGATGSFRSVIQEYLATTAPKTYKKRDLTTVRNSIGQFFKFVVNDLHIDELDFIRTSTITLYIQYQKQRGQNEACRILPRYLGEKR
jgi:hypothetical protein